MPLTMVSINSILPGQVVSELGITTVVNNVTNWTDLVKVKLCQY